MSVDDQYQYIEMKCKTAEDARYRMRHARIGSLAGNPTNAYLLELRNEIHNWLNVVEREIAMNASREAAIEAGKQA